MADTGSTNIPLSCPYTIPSTSTPIEEVLPRWSYTDVAHPALIVQPRTEADIAAAIAYAKARGLRVAPQGGGHGSFLPLTASTLVLDLAPHMAGVSLDEAAGTATIGGGARTGDVLRTLASRGWYVPVVHAGAPGMVGTALGGGSGPFNGLHGLVADGVLSFRVVTAGADSPAHARVVCPSSAVADERALFAALCGAGHGLAVVASMTVRARRVAALGLNAGDRVWTRRLVFPAAEARAAADAFVRLREGAQHMCAALNATVVFARAPSPPPGGPVAVLSATYLGPAAEAERRLAASPLFDGAVVARAAGGGGGGGGATTALVPLAQMQDGLAHLGRRGGHRGIASCFLGAVGADTLVRAFERWARVADEWPDAEGTLVAAGACDTAALREAGAAEGGGGRGRGRFFESRDRGVGVQVVLACAERATWDGLEKFGDELVGLFREDDEEGNVPRSFANNLRKGMRLEELHSAETISELRRVKKVWDADGLFWSPYEEGKDHV